MEKEAAQILWQRSCENKLRYLTYIGDGDCSAHKAVCRINYGEGPYGAEKLVVEEECVNHVHKRKGTALRKLVKDTTTEYTTKAGDVRQRKLLFGKGKLTENVTEKLTDYYGDAIRRNVGKTVEEMQKDIYMGHILPLLLNRPSTDEKQKHLYCPVGEQSWCFW